MRLIHDNINILDYIVQLTGAKPKRQGNKMLIDPCPCCGHFGHFSVYPENNSFCSFSGCCKGGSIIDAIILFEGLSLSEAMRRVHGDSPHVSYKKNEEINKLASLLNDKVEGFFNTCLQKYKLLVYAENEFMVNGIDYTDPFYRWIRQGVRFYDRVTTEFINGNFERRFQLMRDHEDEYFFKLCPEVVAFE